MATQQDTRTNRDLGGDRRPRAAGFRWFLLIVALGALAALIGGLFLIFNDEEGGPEIGVTEDEVVDDPAAFIEQEVTLSGTIDDLIGRHVIETEEGMLYLSLEPIDPDATSDADIDGDIVSATGPVRLFDLATAEEEVGADLDDALFADLEGEPVIVGLTEFAIQEKTHIDE